MKPIDRKKFKDKRLELKRSVMLTPDILYNEAFRSLSPAAMHILFRFMQKRTWQRQKTRTYYRYEDYENGGLSFPYSEAKILGFPETTFNRARDELVCKGFLEIEYPGGDLGNKKDYARYRYIENWKKYGTPEFNPCERPKRVRTSSGFDEYNEQRRKIKQPKMTAVPQPKITMSPQPKTEGRPPENGCEVFKEQMP